VHLKRTLTRDFYRLLLRNDFTSHAIKCHINLPSSVNSPANTSSLTLSQLTLASCLSVGKNPQKLARQLLRSSLVVSDGSWSRLVNMFLNKCGFRTGTIASRSTREPVVSRIPRCRPISISFHRDREARAANNNIKFECALGNGRAEDLCANT